MVELGGRNGAAFVTEHTAEEFGADGTALSHSHQRIEIDVREGLHTHNTLRESL